MTGDLSQFEQQSTKAPIWLPIVGVAMFLLIVLLAILFPGSAPFPTDGGVADGQSQSR